MRWLFLLLLLSCLPVDYYGSNSSVSVNKLNINLLDSIVVETPVIVPVENPVTISDSKRNIPVARKLLAEAQSRFSGYAYLLEDRLVLVYENKSRHMFLKPFYLNSSFVTDVFVDSSARVVCDVEREKDIMSYLDWSRSKCKDFKNVSLPVSGWLPDGPLNYLKRFESFEPFLIEDSLQTVNIGGRSRTVTPSLHYLVDGETVILRIDERYSVPLRIDFENGSVEFQDIFFDYIVIGGSRLKISDLV